MTFPTKVDLWIALMLLIAPAGMAAAWVATSDWRVLFIGVVVLGGIGSIAWPCDYRLEEDELIVRSGIIRMKVPYGDVQSVEPTRNPLSAPAYSLDRLMIRYGKAAIMVSPKNRSRFLDELARRAGLRRYGERLVREHPRGNQY